MKIYGVLCVVVAIIMLLAPMAAISFKKEPAEKEPKSQSVAEETVKTDNSETEKEDTISVFMTADNETEVMDMRDYIIGAVSAEVPASYNEEAIKAQALAAVTFAEYRKQNGSDEDIGGADISDDSSVHQGYMTKSEMQEKWGDAFDTYYKKVSDAVDEVLDKIITYDGEPIMAAYHAISSGKTESAENMWGEDIAYLRTVDSKWDKDSARYSSEVIYSADELKELLKDVPNADFSSDEADWIKIKSTSDAGTVLEAEVCGAEMTGMELRTLLTLRSPVFEAEYADGDFVFTARGYGHGVGMSQNGANSMAQDGYTYEEIIAHYYPGTVIENRK
ncbi:MAG: stage II sporulation protein D [Clostridia bacterium]|nr:stage II sporulation protein D [Clostridia bacterium]